MMETSAESKKIEQLFARKGRGPKEIFSSHLERPDVEAGHLLTAGRTKPTPYLYQYFLQSQVGEVGQFHPALTNRNGYKYLKKCPTLQVHFLFTTQ